MLVVHETSAHAERTRPHRAFHALMELSEHGSVFCVRVGQTSIIERKGLAKASFWLDKDTRRSSIEAHVEDGSGDIHS